MKEIYDKLYSKQSNAWRKRRMPFYKKLASYILPTDIVLDLGCGNGILATASKWKRYVGVDYSDVAIRQARRYCPSATFVCEDIFLFLRRFIYYDIVILTELLEHIEEDKELIKEINVGVRIVISIPNDEPTKDGKPINCRLHLRSYTIENIAERYNMIDFKELFVFKKWIIGVGFKK